MGLNKTATYPASVWDGDSGNRDSDDNRQSAPDHRDWDRMIAEMAATQTELDAEKAKILLIETGITVEVESVGKTGAPNVILVAESGNVIVNEGVILGEKNHHTLPLAAANLFFWFVCNHTDGIRIVANTGDTIRVGSAVTKAVGYIESTVVGSTVMLVAVTATEWVAIQFSGTWVVETS